MSTNAFSPWVDLQNEPDSVHHNGSPQRDPMPLDPERLKKWVRKGRWPVNHELRQKLWYRLCMQKVMSVGSVYKKMAKGMFGDPASEKEKNTELEMPSFGEEDHINTYKLSEAGKKQLTKLLCVMHHTRPDINYCPFLPSIASLLLHYMDTEQAFDALSALLGSQRYKYLEQTFIGFEAFRISFTKLAIKFASPAHKWLLQRGEDPEKVYENWVWWILDDLPFTHLVRVIDVFLVEGLKNFYRVGLAIIVLHKKNRGGEDIQGDLASSIREFVKTIPTSPEILLNVAFQFRGLSRSVIGTYQTKNQIELRAEGKVMSKSPSKQKAIPIVLEEIQSSIINSKQLQMLWKWLPDRIALYQPRLVFTSADDGFSLNTLYLKCEQYEPTVLLIKTTNNEVFGAYLSVSWEERNDDARKSPYFGNGECFLFTLTPKEVHYPWVGTTKDPKDVERSESMFMRATVNELAIGGGEGEGIHVDKDLDKGYSQPCKTFKNASLVTEADGRFQISIIEVLVFEDRVSQENGNHQKSPKK